MHDRLARVSGIGSSLLAVVLFVFPKSAASVQIPETSFSRSLAMRPELVDDTSLLFQYPQRAGMTGSRIFTLDTGSGPVLGALGNAGSHGFFLLTQRSQSPIRDSSVFQVGWGGSWSGLRFGVAARANHKEHFEFRLSSSEEFSNLSSSETRFTLWQGSLGLGFGHDRAELDIVFDAQRNESTLDDTRLSSSQTQGDTLVAHLETQDHVSYGGAGRLHACIGESGDLVVSGSWHRDEFPYKGDILRGTTRSPLRRSDVFDHWSAGLAVAFPVGRIDWLALSAHGRRIESPGFSSSALQYQRNREDRYSIGIAMRQKIWRDLQGHAGIRLFYEMLRREDIQTHRFSPGTEFRNHIDDSRLLQDFSWGATYTWKNFDVHAQVSEILNVDRLFTTLDIIARF